MVHLALYVIKKLRNWNHHSLTVIYLLKSELYYVNYCSDSDFKLFMKQTGMSLKDKICLCKYGHVFRGNKVSTAQKYGARAVILYDDPYRGAPSDTNTTDNTNIYPHGELMPEFGTQRGTIYIHEGDPQTPSYPSIGKI